MSFGQLPPGHTVSANSDSRLKWHTIHVGVGCGFVVDCGVMFADRAGGESGITWTGLVG